MNVLYVVNLCKDPNTPKIEAPWLLMPGGNDLGSSFCICEPTSYWFWYSLIYSNLSLKKLIQKFNEFQTSTAVSGDFDKVVNFRIG